MHCNRNKQTSQEALLSLSTQEEEEGGENSQGRLPFGFGGELQGTVVVAPRGTHRGLLLWHANMPFFSLPHTHREEEGDLDPLLSPAYPMCSMCRPGLDRHCTAFCQACRQALLFPMQRTFPLFFPLSFLPMPARLCWKSDKSQGSPGGLSSPTAISHHLDTSQEERPYLFGRRLPWVESLHRQAGGHFGGICLFLRRGELGIPLSIFGALRREGPSPLFCLPAMRAKTFQQKLLHVSPSWP